MENIIQILSNYGLGFASFIALIYFYMYAIKDIKETNEEISKTLVAIQTNLMDFNQSLLHINSRIEKVENKLKGE